jgi:hypothetical protein
LLRLHAGDEPRMSDEPHMSDELDEGDPRGGIQSDEYRHADPRDLVLEEGTAMSGPAGAPQEELSVEERRDLSEKLRRDR